MSDPRNEPARTNNGSSASGRQRSCCPICHAKVNAGMETYPFCSKRCRLVDLGQWFSGSYTVSRPLETEDFEES